MDVTVVRMQHWFLWLFFTAAGGQAKSRTIALILKTICDKFVLLVPSSSNFHWCHTGPPKISIYLRIGRIKHYNFSVPDNDSNIKKSLAVHKRQKTLSTALPNVYIVPPLSFPQSLYIFCLGSKDAFYQNLGLSKIDQNSGCYNSPFKIKSPCTRH